MNTKHGVPIQFSFSVDWVTCDVCSIRQRLVNKKLECLFCYKRRELPKTIEFFQIESHLKFNILLYEP